MNRVMLIAIAGAIVAGVNHLVATPHHVPADIAGRAGEELVMYTTTDCPYCAQARTWLKRNNVAYRECNTETSRSCDTELGHLGGDGVPTFLYRSEVHDGFDLQWMQQTLLKTS